MAKTLSAPDLLIPEGHSLVDVPADLITAIEQAVRILSWQENLLSKDMPPQWMWVLDWEIDNWFKKIDEERDNNRSGGGNGTRGPREKVEFQDDNVHVDRFK